MAVFVSWAAVVQSLGILAQSSSPMMVERVGRLQGLSETTITAILQDHRGFLWVGTPNGLNRYDGYEFTVFRQDAQDSLSLASNNIKALHEDRSGTLWIGTVNGLHRYNRSFGTFTRFQHNPTNKNSLSSNDISSITSDADGTLWIGTKRGINRFTPRTGAFTVVKSHKKKLGSGLSDNDITVVYAAPANITPEPLRSLLWIGTRNAGLNVLNTTTGEMRIFRSNGTPSGAAIHTSKLAENTILSITSDAQGTIWVGTRGGLNALRYEYSTWHIKHYSAPDLADNAVRSLAVTKHSRLLVGTRNGLTIGTVEGTDWSIVRNRPDNPRSLSDNDVSAVYEDRSGVVWIGTSGNGLNKYVPQTAFFRSYQFATAEAFEAERTAGYVAALYQHRRDSLLWVGTNGGAVALQAPLERGVWTTVLSNTQGGLSDNLVTAFAEDRFNTDIIWIATQNGLNHYSRSRNKVVRVYRHNANDPQSLSDDGINCLHQDHAGNLWIGTSGGGLNLFDSKTGTFRVFRSDMMDSSSLADNFVFAILEDRARNVWIATSGGLSKYVPNAGSFVNYRHADCNAHSLSENSTLSLCEDRAGNIWVGTYGGGVAILNPTTGVFTHITEREGLPNNVVYGVLQDHAGRIWVSTGRGLARIEYSAAAAQRTQPVQSAQPFSLRVYDASDGLLGDEFRKGAFHCGTDGTLYFGVANGFIAFHPDSLRDNLHKPSVVITTFRKLNQPVGLDSVISEKSLLVLEHTDNSFSFEVAALDFTAPAKNQYAYRLEGFDDRWVMLNSERVIRFTNLDPGEYTLHIKASNNNGVWNDEGVQLRIIIRPPWSQTWWFKALVGVGVVVTIFGGYQWRVHSIQLRAKQLEQIVALRTEEITDKNIELEQLLDETQRARNEVQRAYELLAQEHARKSSELEEARLLQLSMLPKKTPSLDHVELAFSMQTATEVGGDYYDYSVAHDGTLTVAIGDATGHGVRAGMLVSIVKSNFHALADTTDVATIVRHIARNIKRMNLQRMFMCLTVLRYTRLPLNAAHSVSGTLSDARSDTRLSSQLLRGRLELAGAGMPPALLYRAHNGTVEHVAVRGIVPGAVADFEYQPVHITLNAGDTLLLMSDGLVELFNAQGDMLGEERVVECLRDVGHHTAQEIVCHINTLAASWLGGEPQNDDIALVALKVL